MKKFIVLFGAALLAISSCRKETPEVVDTPQVPETPATAITYNLDANHPDGATTKAVKTDWEMEDVIFVFFSGSAAPGYLEMKWDGTQWNFTEKNGLAIPDNQTGIMHAVYQPFGNDNQVVADEYGRWAFKDIHFSYYLEDSQSYTITDGQVSGTFNMSVPEGYVQFFLDDEHADSSTAMELREYNITPEAVSVVHPQYGTGSTLLEDGAPMPGYVYDKENKASGEKKGWLFSGVLAEAAKGTATDYHFTLVKGGWQGTYYRKSFLNKEYYTGSSERRALKMPALSTWTEITDYKPIDLGMSIRGEFRRIYWCSRNLGASSDVPAADTDEARKATWGDYYAWGATAPFYQPGHAYDMTCSHWKDGKTGYNWPSYPLSGNNGRAITKYTIPDGEDDADWYDDSGQFIGDNLTLLEPEDDAASTVMGRRWHIPSAQEWEALFDVNYFTGTFDNNNIGVTFTSKIPGFEGRSIFLPLAGARSNDWLGESEEQGYYWTSNLGDSNTAHAKVANINRYTASGSISNYSRYIGMSIRPVTY